jgi:hypothetical protein
MLSRINSTGRQRIRGDMVSFALVGGSPPKFVGTIDFGGLPEVPGNALVFVEVHRQNIIERFDFGTVANTAPRVDTALRELTGENLKFRVKVVEPGTGKLLALGDRFSPDDVEQAGRQPLLNVREDDLKGEPWRTALAENEAQLVLNERIPDAISRLKGDQLFQALILPAAFRQVLLMMWAQRRDVESDPDDDEWSSKWLRFAEHLTGEEHPHWSDDEAVRDWIDDVCETFSSRHDLLSPLVGGALQ